MKSKDQANVFSSELLSSPSSNELLSAEDISIASGLCDMKYALATPTSDKRAFSVLSSYGIWSHQSLLWNSALFNDSTPTKLGFKGATLNEFSWEQHTIAKSQEVKDVYPEVIQPRLNISWLPNTVYCVPLLVLLGFLKENAPLLLRFIDETGQREIASNEDEETLSTKRKQSQTVTAEAYSNTEIPLTSANSSVAAKSSTQSPGMYSLKSC